MPTSFEELALFVVIVAAAAFFAVVIFFCAAESYRVSSILLSI
jgi:hypothetical protein